MPLSSLSSPARRLAALALLPLVGTAANDKYKDLLEMYMLRHRVKPGITGWAQIHGHRGETDTIEKMRNRVQFDLYYIKNWSFLLDMKIIIWTTFKGWTGNNAY